MKQSDIPDITAILRDYRGVEDPCQRCGGWGVRYYGSTATWHGGMGGQALRIDVCDVCWGSGDARRGGTDLRALMAQRNNWEDEQAMAHFARQTGATFERTRAHMREIANILEREERRRKTPFDADSNGFWWRATLRMVAAAMRRFGKDQHS